MAVLFFTDPHISIAPPRRRTSSPFHTVFEAQMDEALAYFRGKDVRLDAVVCGGDLFHTATPPVQIVMWLREYIQSTGYPWFICPGNHDLAYGRRDRTTCPLSLLEGPQVHVAWEPTMYHIAGEPWLIVPFGEDSLLHRSRPNYVVLHSDHNTLRAVGVNSVDPADLLEDYPTAKAVLVGHIHSPFCEVYPSGLTVANPGPFVYRTVTDVDLAHGLPPGFLLVSEGEAQRVGVTSIEDWVREEAQASVTFTLTDVLRTTVELPSLTAEVLFVTLVDQWGDDVPMDVIRRAVQYWKRADGA